jgi:hypothetical protein
VRHHPRAALITGVQGFAFLHSHNIAHRDIAARNIMMDPSPLFPSSRPPNPLRNLTRVPIFEPSPTHSRLFPAPGTYARYWIIDFGLSTMFGSRAERRFVTWDGGPNEHPECWATDPATGERTPTRPYDAFAADVHALGALLQRYFLPALPALAPLCAAMTAPVPDARPALDDCLAAFRTLARGLGMRDLVRGLPSAAALDWQPWSGADAMTRGLRSWVAYMREAAVFLVWRPEVVVGGVRIG